MHPIARLILAAWLLAGLSAPALAADGPVKVFILAGQSNMEGKAAVTTLEAAINDPKTHDQLKHLKDDKGWARRDDVFVTFLDREQTPQSPLHGPLTVGFGSPKRVRDNDGKRIMVEGVGPELGIGWVLGEHFDQPVLLIKAAWGGRAIKQTFRPPSAMPTEEELKARLEEVHKKNPAMTMDELRASYGRDYRNILSETRRVLDQIETYVPGYDPDAGYELAGFIWFQGWNDGVGGGNPAYTEQLAHFIRDLRRDLDAPQLPFVIGELGTDGDAAGGWVATFREQQEAVAKLPEFKGNVAFAKTAPYWPKSLGLDDQWKAFQKAAKENEQKPESDPTRVPPNEFFRDNWLLKYKDQLALHSDKRYHYMGSGRCYYEMGESMARAMLGMIKP